MRQGSSSSYKKKIGRCDDDAIRNNNKKKKRKNKSIYYTVYYSTTVYLQEMARNIYIYLIHFLEGWDAAAAEDLSWVIRSGKERNRTR